MQRSTWPLIIVVLCLLGIGPQAPADNAQDTFDSLYGKDIQRVTAASDPKPAVKLAGDLLAAARSPKTPEDLLALLCAKAYELGVRDPSGYDTAIDAMRHESGG